MSLNKDRIGEIAMIVLQAKIEKEGFNLDPKGIKRDIANNSKKLGIKPTEAAEFAKILIKHFYDKTIAELDSIKDPQD